MTVDERMTAIADALRLKRNGATDEYSLEDIAEGVLDLGYANIPAYHYAEAGRLVHQIRVWKESHPNSLVFGAISDNHVFANDTSYGPKTEASIRHAAFALEAVGSMAECDFVANLGDNCWENGIDTDNALEGAEYTHDATLSALSRVPSFRLVGNHDRSSVTSKTYALNGAYNDFDDYGTTQVRGFGYKDFASKKVRVICLNTTDYLNATGGCGMSYDQKDFLLRALDLSAKSDAAEWQILLLSHIPLDWNGGDYDFYIDLETILSGYIAGGSNVNIPVTSSYALNEDPTAYETYSGGTLKKNYYGKNAAKIIGNIHGHVHTNASGKMVGGRIVRMATPNSCFSLNKAESYPEYGDYSISSTEAAKIAKVENTAKDTSATFYCVDLAGKTITAYAYGAGTDRTVAYGIDVYAVSLNLTNATSSNSATSAEKDKSYTTTIAANDGHELRSVVVTMGGEDITASAYSGGVVSISKVTGDIVITAKASVPAFSYVVPDLDGATRMYWYVGTSGFSLGSGNGYVAVGVSTANSNSFADRESGTLYLMPIPANATNMLIETTDSSFVDAKFMVVSDAGGSLTSVYDSGYFAKNADGGWTADFDRSLGDWMAINLAYSHDGSIKPAWGYDAKSKVTVTFSNGVADDGGSDEPVVNYDNLFGSYTVGRLSSSGGINTSYTGGFVSDLIPATYGDVIRAKSANTAFANNYPVVAFYNGSTYVGGFYTSNTTQVTLSSDGMEFSCDTSVLSATYQPMTHFRVMGYGSPDGFIITKNEAIE